MPSPIKRYRVRLTGTVPDDVAPTIAHRVQPEGVRIRLTKPPPIDTPTEIYLHYGDGRVALVGRGWVSSVDGRDTSFEVEWTSQSDPELLRVLFPYSDYFRPETVSSASSDSTEEVPVQQVWAAQQGHIERSAKIGKASLDPEQSQTFIPSMTLVAEALDNLIQSTDIASDPVAARLDTPTRTSPDLFRVQDEASAGLDVHLQTRSSSMDNYLPTTSEPMASSQGSRATPLPKSGTHHGWLGRSHLEPGIEVIASAHMDAPEANRHLPKRVDASSTQTHHEDHLRFNTEVTPFLVSEDIDLALEDDFVSYVDGESARVSVNKIELESSKAPSVHDLIDDLPSMGEKRRRLSADLNVPVGELFAIDVGAFSVSIAKAEAGDAAKLVELDGFGQELPAVAALATGSETLVGLPALVRLKDQPECAVVGIHHLLGQTPWSKISRQLSARFGWVPVANASGRLGIKVGERTSTPEFLMGRLLKTAADAANIQFVRPSNRIVLTCPTAFGAHQRAALVLAAEDVGLCVEELISASLAVLVHYVGLNHRGLARHILVVGFVAGSLDAAVIRAERRTFSVLASAGSVDGETAVDRWLHDPSSSTTLIQDHYQLAIEQIRAAIKRAGLATDEIDEIILWGEHAEPLADPVSSLCRSTYVLLGRDAVALGAAEVARSRDMDTYQLQLADVTIASIAVGSGDGQVQVIVPRGTPFPAFGETRFSLYPSAPAEILLLQGEGPVVDMCEPFGRLYLEGLPGDRSGVFTFKLRLCLGDLGQADIQVVDVESGCPVPVRFEAMVSAESVAKLLSEPTGEIWTGHESVRRSFFGWLRKKLLA